MAHIMSAPLVLALCAISAACYVAASVVLKLGGHLPFLLLLMPVCGALALAAWFESTALSGNRLGIVALLIMGCEFLVTAGVAIGFGERYSSRELAGLLVIAGGIAIVCHPGAPHDAADATRPVSAASP